MYGIKFLLNKENILNLISEYDIFSYYEPNFTQLNKKFCSSWRGERIASSIIRCVHGTLFYKDYGDPSDKSYTCWNYLKERYSLNIQEVFNVINNDFNLGLNGDKKKPTLGFYGLPNKEIKIEDKKDTIFQIKKKNYSDKDLLYWKQFGINLEILEYFDVHSISHYFINGLSFEIKKNELGFAYYEQPYKYKIYLPSRNKGEKFWSNTGGIVQGYNKLPNRGDTCLITSSKKDIMTLHKLGITSVAPSSENSRISLDIIQDLKDRFNKLYIYYNNDEPGIKAAEDHSKLYECSYIFNPINEPKDPSDFYKKYGYDDSKRLMKNFGII
jgi:hypothetical protein